MTNREFKIYPKAIALAAAMMAASMAASLANAAPDADQRAAELVKKMTIDEKISTVFGYFSTDFKGVKHPKEGVPFSAGFVHGVKRLNIPDQQMTDAGMGVATQRTDKPRLRTSLPSGMATTATWSREQAFAGGAMIGKEARLSGHNIMLAGGVNLVREPRNGRNFEYGGEDPLLAGIMVGQQIRGIQSNNIVSTVKHFAYNDQETGRFFVNVKIDDAAGRMSDLLAFQIAIEQGNPGSVMCSYNKVNGYYGCENDHLLNKVLKKDWGYKGWVMSDWGAVHSTVPAANYGLDQQSGWPFDLSPYFGPALKEAVQNGHVPPARLDDMTHRILRSLIAAGVMDNPQPKVEGDKIDFAAHARISQADAEEGIVLLRNEGALLPLDTAALKTIAIIGSHANVGVLSGGGSAQVYPVGGIPVPNEGPKDFPGPMVYFPSSPMKALAKLTRAKVVYHDGKDAAAAAKLAASSDVAIVFANQWTAESQDVPDLSLPGTQDKLIDAVAAANKKTVVVLQTGGPVLMPWLNKVGAVVEAWYPGTSGGEAIARVLAGEVNPSGRLPVTFPASEAQLPRTVIESDPKDKEARLTVDYDIEGAAVGYKWFELKKHTPLFAFGHGLSYTSFAYTGLAAKAADGGISVSFNVKNSGKREGKAVPQVYVAPSAGGWEAPKRLGGFDKLALKSGEAKDATVSIDPRTLAVFDSASGKWKIAAGEYVVTLAEASNAPLATVKVKLAAREFAAGAR